MLLFVAIVANLFIGLTRTSIEIKSNPDHQLERQEMFSYDYPSDTFTATEGSSLFVSLKQNDWVVSNYYQTNLEESYEYIIFPRSIICSNRTHCFVEDDSNGIFLFDFSDPSHYEIVGGVYLHELVSIYDFDVYENYMVVVTLYSFHILDISDIHNPILLFEYDDSLPLSSKCTFAKNGTVLIFSSNSGCLVFNTTNKESTELVYTIPTLTNLVYFNEYDNVLYLVRDYQNMKVYNFSERSYELTELGTCDDVTDRIFKLEYDHKTKSVFLLFRDDILIIDVSDPSFPFLTKYVEIEEFMSTFSSMCFFQNTSLLFLSGSFTTSSISIKILNISSMNEPTYLTTDNFGAGYPMEMLCYENTIYSLTNNYISLVDVSELLPPETNYTEARAIELSKDNIQHIGGETLDVHLFTFFNIPYLFVADGETGTKVYRVDDPHNIVLLTTFGNYGTSSMRNHQIYVEEDVEDEGRAIFYFTGRDNICSVWDCFIIGEVIVDESDPDIVSMNIISHVEDVGETESFVFLSLHDRRYVLLGSYSLSDGAIIDVTNISNPQLIGTGYFPGCRDLALVQDEALMYAICGDDIILFDVSNITRPVQFLFTHTTRNMLEPTHLLDQKEATKPTKNVQISRKS